jgi:hypothetical protein
MKSASGLAEFARLVFNESWLYKWGAYGNVINGVRRSDCYGVRKAYSWDRGGYSVYNKSDDRNVRTAYNIALVKGKIATLPEKPGIIVCKYYYSKLGMGHAGVYLGNGLVLDIYKTGQPARIMSVDSYGWTHWFEDTSIDYTEYNKPVVKECPYTEPKKTYRNRITFRGNDAFWFQCQLIRIGHNIKLDGVAGAITWEAINWEQKMANLGAGDAGVKTRDWLKSLPTR